MIDREEARWIAGLVEQALDGLPQKPGLTLEVIDQPMYWLQIVPEIDEETGRLGAFLLNFPYRDHADSPLLVLSGADIMPPPGTTVDRWEDHGFARIRLRPDVPLIPLALFMGEVLEKIVGAPADGELKVFIEYGF
ncbi:MAG: hypothetical protein GYB64_20070 [Chloroflexi bacterium]|nr:hypothetical protein [Chloroflexota bacterium]